MFYTIGIGKTCEKNSYAPPFVVHLRNFNRLNSAVYFNHCSGEIHDNIIWPWPPLAEKRCN